MKYVYLFEEGNKDMKELLGGKGANLAEMTNIGLPVPPGFTITTQVCTHYYQNKETYPPSLEEEITSNIEALEKKMGAQFGNPKNPLLVSVRSGARASMPGMMDTILNLGMNDKVAVGLAEKTSNPRFVYDSYRRFVQMYADVVLGVELEHLLEEKKKKLGAKSDTDLTAADLKQLVDEYKKEVEKNGKKFPEDPLDQLWGAVGAVFSSWNNERAIAYRKMYDIPADWGTAVNIQVMTYGNMGADSGTGVAFTRDPATGENIFYGEYLMNAQGEDVVAGIRTPLPMEKMKTENPQIYQELEKIRKKLESHYKDMLDIEFTIQNDKLWMLQCRVGKRTAFAAMKIAADMIDENLITDKQALLRLDPEQLNHLLQPIFDHNQKEKSLKEGNLLAKGLNAGPGAATGRVVFSAPEAESWAKRGESVILTRIETSPEDIKGMKAAKGILTARGGMTSHAALVARQMGKVCVAGCADLDISYADKRMTVKGKTVKEGDWISLDGTTGEIMDGELETKPSEIIQVLLEKTMDPKESEAFQDYDKIMKAADRYRKLKIRTNADQPDQATNAIAFGAQGIGLCRTEHMFFGEGKIGPMREMILAESEEARRAALDKLLPLQRADFEGLFRAMNGFPVTIRLLDPPLHEFLPHEEKDQKEMAEGLNVHHDKIKSRVRDLHEFNPMLGHRGCRLGISYPEITEMQARAIIEAAVNVTKEGIPVEPEIMVPLISTVTEFEHQETVVRKAAEEVIKENDNIKLKYLVGTMIEIPRAAITADEVAKTAEFFSFGTNDLTQMTMGLSRDDSGKFLGMYQDTGILANDPFQTVDQTGVGELMKICVAKGRAVRPNLKIGICGEHGGDPKSVEFCHRIGQDYVSCSPFRVPIARLAAAQAALR